MTILDRHRREIPLYIMLLVPVMLVLVYSYGPMFGIVMAFQRYETSLGFLRSEWVGFDNYRRIFALPDTWQVIFNTFYIASMKIVVETLAAIAVALLLNEIRSAFFKRTIQTIIYFPYFLSWVILGGALRDMLSSDGLINQFRIWLGFDAVSFLGIPKLFPFILVITETWQITGFGTIIFLAAIAGINQDLYEAAVIDGAGRLKQTWHITLPGISSTIIVMCVISMGYILNAGFDQILMLYNPLVLSTGDVIDTWVYRAGLQHAQFSLAAAMGLMRSIVSFILISISYYLAYKFADYRIF